MNKFPPQSRGAIMRKATTEQEKLRQAKARLRRIQHFEPLRKAYGGFRLDCVAAMSSARRVLKVFGNASEARSVLSGARRGLSASREDQSLVLVLLISFSGNSAQTTRGEVLAIARSRAMSGPD